MDFELADGHSIRLLAPFSDMLNHSSEIKQCHLYDALSGDVSILAGKDYEVGDQVSSLRSLIDTCAYLGWIHLDLYQLWTYSKQSPLASLRLCHTWQS